jgi:hypothetical protein
MLLVEKVSSERLHGTYLNQTHESMSCINEQTGGKAGFCPGWFDGDPLFLIITGQLVLRTIHYSEFVYTTSTVTVAIRYFNVEVE